MRARKEERNQAMWQDWKSGMMMKDIAKKYNLCTARTCTILHNQDRWNAEKRMNPYELKKHIERRMKENEADHMRSMRKETD